MPAAVILKESLKERVSSLPNVNLEYLLRLKYHSCTCALCFSLSRSLQGAWEALIGTVRISHDICFLYVGCTFSKSSSSIFGRHKCQFNRAAAFQPLDSVVWISKQSGKGFVTLWALKALILYRSKPQQARLELYCSMMSYMPTILHSMQLAISV